MPTETTTRVPTLCVVDSNRSLAPQYRTIADRLGLHLRMHHSGDQFRDTRKTSLPSCLVVSVRQDELEILNFVHDISQRQIDLPLIIAIEKGLADSAFDAVGPGTIALLKHPIDFIDLETLVTFAILRQQEESSQIRKLDDFNQIVAMLSERQRQILDLMAGGIPNKAIASQMNLSLRTIETDRAVILKTFGVENATDVAIRIGEYRSLNRLRVSRNEQMSKWMLRTQSCEQINKDTVVATDRR